MLMQNEEINSSQALPFKVEAKGSLYEVTLSEGAYSDHNIYFYIFSGNSDEEVWEFVKVWAKSGGIPNNDKLGLVWNTRKFQYAEHDLQTQFYKKQWGQSDSLDWDSAYGDAYDVTITRASVIYVRPEELLKDTIVE